MSAVPEEPLALLAREELFEPEPGAWGYAVPDGLGLDLDEVSAALHAAIGMDDQTDLERYCSRFCYRTPRRTRTWNKSGRDRGYRRSPTEGIEFHVCYN